MSIRILYTQIGIIIGEFIGDDSETISIKNPRQIEFSQKGVNLINYMVMVKDDSMTFYKSTLVSMELTPVKELEDAYLSEFKEKSNLIIPDSKIVV